MLSLRGLLAFFRKKITRKPYDPYSMDALRDVFSQFTFFRYFDLESLTGDQRIEMVNRLLDYKLIYSNTRPSIRNELAVISFLQEEGYELVGPLRAHIDSKHSANLLK